MINTLDEPIQGFAVLQQIVHGAHVVGLSPPSFAKMQALNTAGVLLESTSTSKVHRRTRILSGLERNHRLLQRFGR